MLGRLETLTLSSNHLYRLPNEIVGLEKLRVRKKNNVREDSLYGAGKKNKNMLFCFMHSKFNSSPQRFLFCIAVDILLPTTYVQRSTSVRSPFAFTTSPALPPPTSFPHPSPVRRQQMRKSQILDVNGNMLTQLPPRFGQLRLRSLKLSYNRLETLRHDLFQPALKETLQQLWLSNNNLLQLPDSLVEVRGLACTHVPAFQTVECRTESSSVSFMIRN